jgi:hypothetical protein
VPIVSKTLCSHEEQKNSFGNVVYVYSVVCVFLRRWKKFLLRNSDVLNALLEFDFVEILLFVFIVLCKDGSSTAWVI